MSQIQHKSRAFTLIELTLSVLMLAILTAVGIPSFKALYSKSESQKVAAEFINTLRYAQQRAIIERVPIRLVIDVKEQKYWVPVEEDKEKRHYSSRSRRASSHRRESRRKNRVREVKEIRSQLPRGFIFEFVYKVAEDDEIKRGEGEFYFYPDGSADAAFFTILRLGETKADENRMFIKVSSSSGTISSMEGQTSKDGSPFYKGEYDDRRYVS